MVLVAYDISNDAVRSLVARRLLAMGFSRIQRSVFVRRGSYAVARDVARLLARLVDPSSDRVHVIVVQDRDWGSRIVIGGEGVDEAGPVHLF